MWRNRVGEVRRAAARLTRQDLSGLITSDFLEPHATEVLGRDGYPMPLLEDPDGGLESLRIRLLAYNPEYEGRSDKPRHEHYLEGDDRFTEDDHRHYDVNAFFGLGGLAHVGTVAHDSNPEDNTANPYAANHVSLSGGYSGGRQWGSDRGRMGGGVEISLATVFGRSFKHTMDVFYVLEHTRQPAKGPREHRTLIAAVPRGMQTSTPQVHALDLGLPVPQAARTPLPAVIPRVPIHQELVLAGSHVQGLDGWSVLPTVRRHLSRIGVDVDDLDTARSVEAAFRNETLRSHYRTLRRDGAHLLLGFPAIGGMMSLVGVRVSVREGALRHHRQRPEAKVTTGGQGFAQTRKAKVRETVHRAGADLDGRVQLQDAFRITGGAAANYETKKSIKHIETTTDRDIRRSATIANDSEEYRATTTYEVTIVEGTAMPAPVKLIATLLHSGVVAANWVTDGRVRQLWQQIFPPESAPRPVASTSGSVRILSPNFLSVAPGLARTDLPSPGMPLPRPTSRLLNAPPALDGRVMFSREVAATIQALDASSQVEFARWLPGTTLPGGHRLSASAPPEVRHYDPTGVLAYTIRAAVNRSNVLSNIGSLLRGEYTVPGHGGTSFRAQLVLGKGRWLTRGGLDALNFGEHSVEGESEFESSSGTDYGFHLSLSDTTGDDGRYFAGAAWTGAPNAVSGSATRPATTSSTTPCASPTSTTSGSTRRSSARSRTVPPRTW